MQVKTEFVNNITIKLSKYEDERKKRIFKLIITEIITLAIAYLSGYGFLFFGINDIPLLLIACGLITFFAIGYFFYNIPASNKEFKKLIKQRCRKDILKTFNLETLKGLKFSKEELVKSNLFSTFNKIEYDDIIEGKHNNVDYTIAETKLIKKGKNIEFTAFKGLIISFKSNKKIKADTLITTKGDFNIRNYPTEGKFLIYWFSISMMPTILFFIVCLLVSQTGGNLLKDVLTGVISPTLAILLVICIYLVQKKKMEEVKLETASFEKRFNVYTKDQIEARYLLTPAFMERLQSLETAFGTRKIKCSFFDDRIMFAIPCKKDLFELGSLFKPLNSNESIEEFYNEIISIQGMIDHFKLNEKIGL